MYTDRDVERLPLLPRRQGRLRPAGQDIQENIIYPQQNLHHFIGSVMNLRLRLLVGRSVVWLVV